MKVLAAFMSLAVLGCACLYQEAALAKTKTPQQGNSATASANTNSPSTNSTKKPGGTCDKTKQATADYKACLDAAAKATQNKGKSKKQGN